MWTWSSDGEITKINQARIMFIRSLQQAKNRNCYCYLVLGSFELRFDFAKCSTTMMEEMTWIDMTVDWWIDVWNPWNTPSTTTRQFVAVFESPATWSLCKNVLPSVHSLFVSSRQAGIQAVSRIEVRVLSLHKKHPYSANFRVGVQSISASEAVNSSAELHEFVLG